MSDYHILELGPKGDRATVAFHVYVPPGAANSAGVSYRTAVAEWVESQAIGSGEPVVWSRIPGLDTTDLESGAVIEVVETVGPFSAALTPGEKRNQIEARYSVRAPQILTDWQARLTWWGYEANVT